MQEEVIYRTFPPFIKWTLITITFSLGAGYAMGPEFWYSAPAFDILKGIPWLPFRAWGVMFMVVAIFMASTQLVGYATGFMLFMIWEMSLVIAAFELKLTGWGGVIWPLLPAALCVFEVYRWGHRHAADILRRFGER